MVINYPLINRSERFITKSITELAKDSLSKTNLSKKTANIQTIMDMLPAGNRRTVGNTSIAGPTFSNKSMEELKALKDAGITDIVDFRAEATPEFSERCQHLGFNFTNFPLELMSNFSSSNIFIPNGNARTKVSDNFVKNLKNFFEIVNKGNVYMGCKYGVHRTNTGVLLNYLLNPKQYPAPKMLNIDGENKKTLINQTINGVMKIIRRLSPEQRAELQIANDFEKNIFPKKIGNLLAENRSTIQ